VAKHVQTPTDATAAWDRPRATLRASVTSPATALTRGAPLLLAAAYLVMGYLHYAPGLAFDSSPEDYRGWSFPAFKYTDLIWLYLRDGLANRPLPYVDYALEYPPLTGLLSYLLSLAPGIEANFALTYLVLALCGLGTIAALHRVPGANPWFYAAAPALLFYTGYQWDPAAIAVTALGLVAYARGNDRWGTVAMTAAVWFKLFPIVWVGAAVVDRVRERRYRAAVEIIAIFAALSAAINVPLALANWEGWRFFFDWNRTRPADSGFWVFLQHLSIADATRLSLLLAAAGAVGLSLIALQSRRPVLLPLGATVLIWWLLVNKTFTTHLVLWVFLAIAVLRPPVLLWAALVALDITAFQLGNYLNVPIVDEFKGSLLIPLGWRYLYDPLQLLRAAPMLFAIAWAADRRFLDRAGSEWLVARGRLLRRDPPNQDVRTGTRAPMPRPFLAGAMVLVVAAAIPPAAWAAATLSGKEVRGYGYAETTVVRQRQPTFSGVVPDGFHTVALHLRPAVPVRWSVQPVADNTYETQVPVALPPGTYQVSLNGNEVSEFVVADGEPGAGETGPRPTLRGQVAAGTDRVRFSLSPPVELQWTSAVDTEDRDYTTTVPVQLDPGIYSLYIGGFLARRFVITQDAT